MYIPTEGEDLTYPFTETGFAGGNKAIVPEYKTRSRFRFNDGDKLYIMDSKTGEKTKSYRYDRDEGWIEE